MSWDIVIFNSKQKIELVVELDENWLEPTDFTGILENSFDRIQKNDNHREIIGTNFTIDFFINKEYSSNLMLQLNRENRLHELIELAKKHSWQIYDSWTEGMINLKNSENNRFDNHRKYVKQILKRK